MEDYLEESGVSGECPNNVVVSIDVFEENTHLELIYRHLVHGNIPLTCSLLSKVHLRYVDIFKA